MAQVINDSTAGGRIGASFGNVLGQGLQQLAQHKMTQLQQRNQAMAFQKAGYSPEASTLLTQFQGHPETQRKLMQSLGALGAGMNNQEQMQFQQPQQQQLPQTGIENLQALTQPQQQDQFQNPMIAQALQKLGLAHGQPGMPGYMPPFSPEQSQGILGQQPTAQQQPQQPRAKSIPEALAGYKTPQMQQAEKFHNEKIALKEREIARPVIKEIAEKRSAIKQQTAALNKQLALSESGEVNNPAYLSMLRGIGLDVPTLKKPGTAEFDALGVNFLTNLKSYFGARPTNFDVSTYLNKLAKSIDTKEGRKRLITNYKRMLKAENLINDTKMDIIKENNNTVPVDLDFQAQERTDKRIDKIWDEFVADAEGGESSRVIRSFDALPNDLADLEGMRIKDTKTNQFFRVRNGKKVKE